jgi:hypothetical protein
VEEVYFINFRKSEKELEVFDPFGVFTKTMNGLIMFRVFLGFGCFDKLMGLFFKVFD